MTQITKTIDVDALAQEIRRIDGNHSLGAGALAEALIPFLSTLPIAVEGKVKALEWTGEEGGPGHDVYAKPSGYHHYTVRHLSEAKFDVILHTDTGSIWFAQEKRGNYHGTYAEAKAAAQADYDLRGAEFSSPGKDGGQEVEAVKPVICIGRHTIDRLVAGHDVEIEAAIMIPASDLSAEPICHLVWRQGRISIDDVEDYYEVARRGDKSVDGSDPFPVYPQPASTALVERLNNYEEILRVVCHHLELPQSESGPADDLTLYDRALEVADVMYRETEAERVVHQNARYKAEADAVRWHKVAMEAGAITCRDGTHIYPRRDRIAELETVLRSVEDLIFGSTLRVGSPEYFGVRKLIRDALSASQSTKGEADA